MTGAEPTLPIRLNVVIFKLRDFTYFFLRRTVMTHEGDCQFSTNGTNMRLSETFCFTEFVIAIVFLTKRITYNQ